MCQWREQRRRGRGRFRRHTHGRHHIMGYTFSLSLRISLNYGHNFSPVQCRGNGGCLILLHDQVQMHQVVCLNSYESAYVCVCEHACMAEYYSCIQGHHIDRNTHKLAASLIIFNIRSVLCVRSSVRLSVCLSGVLVIPPSTMMVSCCTISLNSIECCKSVNSIFNQKMKTKLKMYG